MKTQKKTGLVVPDTLIMQALRYHASKNAYSPIGFPENLTKQPSKPKKAGPAT